MAAKKASAEELLRSLDFEALQALVEKLKVKERKDPATGEMYFVTNNQKCSWIAPLQMLGTSTYTAKCVVRPGQGLEVDKGRFNEQYRYNKAFQFLVDKGLLIADKKVKKLDLRDLKNTDRIEPPPELGGAGKVERLDIVNKAVTIDVTSNRDLKAKGK